MRKILFLACLNLTACVEPHDFDLGEAVPTLVIDAQLTNEVKAHYVKLMWTSGFEGEEDSTEISVVSGASVWVVDDQEVKTDFAETEAGIYLTDPSFSGIPGRSYTLHVQTADGNEYRSTPERQLKPVAIDSLYGRYLELPSTEDDTFIKGVQVLLDTHDEEHEFSNFRYEYIEDYEIRVAYPYLYDWDPLSEVYTPNPINVRTCYVKDQPGQEVLNATTHGLMNNRLAEFPITMLEIDEPRLRHQYSIRVKQYSISSSAYQYYKDLKENNESSGSFSDKQKGTVIGNMINETDIRSPVLGYFEVAGVSEGYRQFSALEFEQQGFSPSGFNEFYRDCDVNQISVVLTDFNKIGEAMNENLRIFSLFDGIPTGDPKVVILPERCSDCRVHGDLDKPKFWN